MQMILNHKGAIEFLVESADYIGFNRFTILNLHGFLAENLLANPDAAGRLRRIPVVIGQSKYIPLEIPQLIEECFEQILATAEAIEDPFEQSFFILVHLPYLQPFDDANKRVSRIAANIPFVKNNFSPLSFSGVADELYIRGLLGVYELNRVELLRDVFVEAYKRSAEQYTAVRQSLGEPDLFRLRHSKPIKQTVGDVVKGNLDRNAAREYVIDAASHEISNENERAKFTRLVETEIYSIHEGNFARYGITPGEFLQWQSTWKST